MALASVTVTFQAKRTNNTFVFPTQLQATKPNRAAADADIASQIQVLASNAQGSADELNELAAMF